MISGSYMSRVLRSWVFLDAMLPKLMLRSHRFEVFGRCAGSCSVMVWGTGKGEEDEREEEEVRVEAGVTGGCGGAGRGGSAG